MRLDSNKTPMSIASFIKNLPDRISRAVVAREFRPLAHGLAVIVIVGAVCLFFYQNFIHRGVLMHVDMTWALSLSRINEIYRHTWLQYGSGFGTFYVMSALWEYPLLLIAQLLHLSTASYLLTMFIGTVSLAGISMYVLAYRTICSFKLTDTWKYAPFIGALAAGLIYMFNPWSLGHLWPYYMYPAYALLPLTFLAMIAAFKSPSLKNIVVLALLVAFSTNAPINVVWLWFMIAGYTIYFLVIKGFRAKTARVALKVAGGSLSIWVAMAAVWMLPYLSTVFSGNAPIPSYSVDQSMLNGLSINNSMLNNLRLTAGWAFPVKVDPTNVIATFLTLALPMLAVLGLIVLKKQVRRDGNVMYMALLALASLALATGTSFFLKSFYSYFALKSAALGWLIRVPDRWLVFVPMLYAGVIGALFSSLLKRRTERPAVPDDGERGGEIPG
jgi:hypothetical protein